MTRITIRLPLQLFAALSILGFPLISSAYSQGEMRQDCQAAEEIFAGQKSSDPFHAIRGARCIAYVSGFADGYSVSDYLADKLGMQLNAFCLPDEGDLSLRLVRSALAQLDRTPPKSQVSTANILASAFSRTFPCPDTDIQKKTDK